MRTKLLAIFSSWLLMALLLVGLSVQTSAQGNETVFNTVLASNFYRSGQRAAITVTNNSLVNPTGTYQRITSAASVGTSGANIVVKPAGTWLVLANTGTNTITFTETGTLISAGNIVLGAGDTTMLISDGTNWRQLAGSNN